MTALELKEKGDAVIKWEEGGIEYEATVRPHRSPHRTLRVLERHLRAQAPALVLHTRSDGHLIEKFELPDEARLLSDHHCWYHLPGLEGMLRGRLYVFTTHIAFSSRPSLLFRRKGHVWKVRLCLDLLACACRLPRLLNRLLNNSRVWSASQAARWWPKRLLLLATLARSACSF